MKRHTSKAAYKEESRLFYIAVFSCVAVFAAYVYFLSASIVHVVMRKEADTQIASLGTSVSQLEARYIEMQHSVSSEVATHDGFVVADKKIFIDKAKNTLVLLQN